MSKDHIFYHILSFISHFPLSRLLQMIRVLHRDSGSRQDRINSLILKYSFALRVQWQYKWSKFARNCRFPTHCLVPLPKHHHWKCIYFSTQCVCYDGNSTSGTLFSGSSLLPRIVRRLECSKHFSVSVLEKRGGDQKKQLLQSTSH